ncbi:MAG: hypothetical protein AAFS10_02475 [Myxococcota bacterium]
MMIRTVWVGVALMGLVWGAGCSSSTTPLTSANPVAASALNAYTAVTSSEGALVGHGVFSKAEDGNVRLMLVLEDVDPGVHEVFLREQGGCTVDDASAHLARVGQVEVDDHGQGFWVHSTDRWSMGTGQLNDILGRALVIRAQPSLSDVGVDGGADDGADVAADGVAADGVGACGIIKSSKSHTVALYGTAAP